MLDAVVGTAIRASQEVTPEGRGTSALEAAHPESVPPVARSSPFTTVQYPGGESDHPFALPSLKSSENATVRVPAGDVILR